jgi:peroxiredoxin
MARTASNMIPLGTKAPSFSLYDAVSGRMRSLDELASKKATVIMFICNHCPFVKHLASGISSLARDYTQKGISFIAISSNDIQSYPEDSPERMKLAAEEYGFIFPYLYDETQQVARDYDAACTPDFYVFDGFLSCVYRGQFDDSRPDNGIPVSGADLRAALDAILAEKPVPGYQKPSLGCNIKWKAAS